MPMLFRYTKHKDEVKPSQGHSKVVQKLLSAFTILVRLCQTLNLSSMFVSLSIEENPNIIYNFFNIKINSLSLFGFKLYLRSCVPQGNHSLFSKQDFSFFILGSYIRIGTKILSNWENSSHKSWNPNTWKQNL